MRQEQAAALEPLPVLLDVEVAHVLGHRGRERRALAEKEVGAARSAEEIGSPRGVAGVDKGAIGRLDAVAERDRILLMGHAEGLDPDVLDLVDLTFVELDEAQLE